MLAVHPSLPVQTAQEFVAYARQNTGIINYASPAVGSPRLRAIAAATPQRALEQPDLPTLAEAGFPGAETQSWHGLVAPAATDDAIVRRLADAVVAAVLGDEFQARMRDLSGEPLTYRAAAFKRIVSEHSASVLPAIAALGINLE